ncbi:hypothetical protein QEJ31_01005 [Pigmentibacter sp. JX0631]|uniref:hypothetical protein n=1 Tax=Pigmentibacter sp. JX0631 TaxID=2976982 RepID=UPI002469705F|nr:hypothetical protein [Pigmentibacter sp. JX0631]WGL60182.1 hypothetical protein QEJ31_01005 [Pigmentibacter sp. JX0631]
MFYVPKKLLGKVNLSACIGVVTLYGCSLKSGQSNIDSNSSNFSVATIDMNPKQDMQNYLLIGAKGRAGKGAVFRCQLDGTKCLEYIGGNLDLQQYLEKPNEVISLLKGEHFASGIAANQSFIYIGAMFKPGYDQNSKHDPKSTNGAIYKCDLLGKICELINLSSINLVSNDRFGASIFATKDSIYIGSSGRDSYINSIRQNDDVGAIFKFNIALTNGKELIGGKIEDNGIKFLPKDNFGSSIFLTQKFIYAGSSNRNKETGTAFICEISGNNCKEFNTNNLNLNSKDQFGSSIYGTNQYIFIGAPGRKSSLLSGINSEDIGAVFRCNTKGEDCQELFGAKNQKKQDINLENGDRFGSSIMIFDNYIYIGAEGRKDQENNKTGSVFKCDLEGNKCSELVGGKSKDNLGAKFGLKDGDLFGSSITIATLPITENNNIINENCSEQKIQAGNVSNNFKYTMCNILSDLNKTKIKFINAFSSMNNSTLILTESQGSFRLLANKTGLYIGVGTVYEYWGSRDWVSSNPSDAFNSGKKLLAFGEIKNSISQIGNIWNGIWDIRFIDDNGNILKASSLINGNYAGHSANYTIEKTLEKNYINNVFSAFILSKSNGDELYFLKKDGNYDILDPIKYSIIDTGSLSELFSGIPKNDIQFIDYSIKLKDKIVLFKRSNINNQYQGFYILDINDVIGKNKEAQIVFIQRVE